MTNKLCRTIVRNNIVIWSLLFGYIAIVIIGLETFPHGHEFLQIAWFNPPNVLIGLSFCLLCLILQFTLPKFRSAFTLENYLQFIIIILLLAPYESAFASYKQFITGTMAGTCDRALMELDSVIHFGHAPWELFDFCLKDDAVLHTIDVVYMLWFVMLIGCSFWMGISKRHQLRRRYFISAIFIWSLLGSGTGTLLYSVGPCYYAAVVGEPGPYGPLMRQLEQAHQKAPLLAVRNQQLLWEAKTGRQWIPFGGISAMPSVHVAMAVLFALILGEAFPLLGLTGWLFALCIQIGSVVLAWHYAVDGYASGLVTVLVWKLLKTAKPLEPDA